MAVLDQKRVQAIENTLGRHCQHLRRYQRRIVDTRPKRHATSLHWSWAHACRGSRRGRERTCARQAAGGIVP